MRVFISAIIFAGMGGIFGASWASASVSDLAFWRASPQGLVPAPTDLEWNSVFANSTQASFDRVLGELDRTGFSKAFIEKGAAHSLKVWWNERDRVSLWSGTLSPEVPPLPRSPRRTLEGVRIALDPGHIGGKFWDHEAGKYVRAPDGAGLYEGELTLATALLLRDRLVKKGAVVYLTREGLEPVTQVDYQHFPFREFAEKEIRSHRFEKWITQLLSQASSPEEAWKSVEESRVFHTFSASKLLWQYFFMRAELDARAEKIRNFSPDLTLVIHFDTSDPPGNSAGLEVRPADGVKAYVAGNYQALEAASPEDRVEFLKTLADGDARERSKELGRRIIQEVGASLQLKPDHRGGDGAIEIESGLFLRDLRLLRYLHQQVVSYVECLFYNEPTEFRNLEQRVGSYRVPGGEVFYSTRLVALADALERSIEGQVQAGGLLH